MQNREGQFLFAALREASRSPRDQPGQNEARADQARQQKHRSHKPDCPRISNLQAFRKQRDLLAIHSLDGLDQSRSHLPDPFACGMAATAESM
jgi:hypothetical protein